MLNSTHASPHDEWEPPHDPAMDEHERQQEAEFDRLLKVGRAIGWRCNCDETMHTEWLGPCEIHERE